ncbi:hypothetical protein UlMin_044181, partial [Ulmus minor]
RHFWVTLVLSVRFSASGNNIASASVVGTVRIWTYDHQLQHLEMQQFTAEQRLYRLTGSVNLTD